MFEANEVELELGVGEVITIDGPAASGKSSVSRELARRLGYAWVSTGAFYRGLAYLTFVRQIDVGNEKAVEALAVSGDLRIRMTAEQTQVFVDNANVTEEISREEIGSLASKVSSYSSVRRALLSQQRDCARGVQGLVAEGRDCGTVVFPQARVKFFLTANPEDRAARRAREEGRDAQSLIDEQKVRDSQDANRKVAPMQASPGSFNIDTSRLSLAEVVDQVEKKAREILG